MGQVKNDILCTAGNIVYFLRFKKRITQKELARQARLGISTIYRIEKRKNCRLSSAIALARVFRKSTFEVFPKGHVRVSNISRQNIVQENEEKRERYNGHIELHATPYPKNREALAYFGPVYSEAFVSDSRKQGRSEWWRSAIKELLELLSEEARSVGCNSVVGWEIEIEPFAESSENMEDLGIKFKAVGTAALIVECD